MCVATPMKVVSIDGSSALVSAAGLQLEVGLDLVEGVTIGDYVIVHAGYAISRLEPAEAEETLALLARLQEIDRQLRERADEHRADASAPSPTGREPADR